MFLFDLILRICYNIVSKASVTAQTFEIHSEGGTMNVLDLAIKIARLIVLILLDYKAL